MQRSADGLMGPQLKSAPLLTPDAIAHRAFQACLRLARAVGLFLWAAEFRLPRSEGMSMVVLSLLPLLILDSSMITCVRAA